MRMQFAQKGAFFFFLEQPLMVTESCFVDVG